MGEKEIVIPDEIKKATRTRALRNIKRRKFKYFLAPRMDHLCPKCAELIHHGDTQFRQVRETIHDDMFKLETHIYARDRGWVRYICHSCGYTSSWKKVYDTKKDAT